MSNIYIANCKSCQMASFSAYFPLFWPCGGSAPEGVGCDPRVELLIELVGDGFVTDRQVS